MAKGTKRLASSFSKLSDAEFSTEDALFMVAGVALVCLLGWTALMEVPFGTKVQWWQWMDGWFLASFALAGGRVFGSAGVLVTASITIGVGIAALVYTEHPDTTACKAALALLFSFLL